MLTWATQFCTSILTHFLDIHLKVLKVLYHASVFEYLDCQGWTLGAMPIHFGSHWNPQMQYQRGFMARLRFVFTGKHSILYLCTYLHTHNFNAAICSLSRNWLLNLQCWSVFTGMLLLDYVNVKKMSGKPFQSSFGVLSCHHSKIDILMSNLWMDYLVLWLLSQFQLKKVCTSMQSERPAL